MRNLKLTIQYDGTGYSGWQFQKNGLSVQEVIQNAIKKITGEKVCVVGSGRTDAGVHAEAQVANFKTSSKIPLKKFQMALNSVLPKDIVIARMEEAGLKFNAQHDARGKLYRYIIVNNDFVNPLLRRFAAKCFYALDLGAMKKAARYLAGRHDFRSFQAKDGVGRNAVRTIRKITIEKKGDLVYIYMEADGFLYNMARNITGTLIEVGRGKISAGDVRVILRKKDRKLCGPTMPARGLCLVKVKY
ncbi:MAG: tRNA pseudouridine(38-40) synthase TruA [Candidatus Omnitrophota bacterium]|nr:tRNA pseudouridine(38-40) synthase TruA [Candidatus Omnitrophota bacterium]